MKAVLAARGAHQRLASTAAADHGELPADRSAIAKAVVRR